MSLAVGGRKGKTTYAYAGVNASSAAIEKGKNEHLRVLGIEQSKTRSSTASSTGSRVAAAKVAEVSRTALFTDTDTATYQRLLRVAGGMGAAASAMGKDPQLAVFETTGPTPKIRGVMELPLEAEDLDIIQVDENQYQVAFCYKYELHVVNIGKETTSPALAFKMPEENSVRPTFRALRYLTPNFIVAATNLPKRSGAVLQVIRLHKTPGEQGKLAASAKIDRPISATALAVTNLTPQTSPATSIGETQFVMAVAGSDSSISLFTAEHSTSVGIFLLTRLLPFHTITDAHGGGNVSALAFSTFVSPKTHLRPLFIKLASTCLEKVVAVHHIPLERHVDKSPRNKKGPPRAARYVVGMKPKEGKARAAIIGLTVSVLLLALVAQGMLEMYSQRKPILHVHKFLPSWHGTLRSAEHQPPVLMNEGRHREADEFIASLLGQGHTLAEGQRIVLRESKPESADGGEVADTTVVVEVQDTEKPPTDGDDDATAVVTKSWGELSEAQKAEWRDKLTKAGQWTKSMGETVLKGIAFHELAGVVEHVIADEL